LQEKGYILSRPFPAHLSSSINRISHATINSPTEEDFLETLSPFNGIKPDRADGLRGRRG
jgi:hypothetical protein